MPKKITISLCMIVLNEEDFLGRSLKNVSPYVDEIIIVDGGSADGTLQIAEKFGAKIIHAPWKEDFASQRNISLKHATKEWILVMDADEVYEKTLLESLQELPKNNLGIDAFAFPRKNYIDGKLTDAYPDRQTRFFRNSKKIKYKNKIHEQVFGFKFIAAPTYMHIIHRKTSKRQERQNAYYHKLYKKYKLNYYKK